MEALSINYLIKDSPAAVAIVDTQMRFISHSDVWLKQFNLSTQTLAGKSYYDVLPNTPDELKEIHAACLAGAAMNVNKGQKFILEDESFLWYKWKINSWKNDVGEIGGLIITQEDITEEKREEELLKIAEHVAKIGGWEVNLRTGQVYWTDVTKEIHEVPQTFEPNIEEGILFYKEGQYRDLITQLINTAIEKGTPWDTELILVTAKGKELWVRAKGQVEMVNGKPLRLFGTFQDIDKAKKSRLKFREATERLAVATKGANVGIWDFNILDNELVWDDNMYHLYGINKNDFDGVYQAWQSGLHPDDREKGERDVAMAIAGEKEFDTQFRIIWPNGEIRHIKASAVTQRDKNGIATKMVGINWDITELMTTRLKLERSRESFESTFENSTIGMAIVGLDGKWISVNEGLCQSLGYTEEELLALTFQDITHPDDLDTDLSMLQQVLDREISTYQLEKRYYHKKGHVVHIILTVTAVVDINDKLSHFISQILDITPRIRAEKKMKRLLEVTKEQNDSLLNFAHIVSHNLRSHSSNLSMLSGFLSTEEDEKEKENLLVMLNNAVESLNETILHLNEVVQVKAGALESLKDVRVSSVLKNVEKNLSLLLQEKDVVCKINVPDTLKIKGVPAYFDSIFLNLFSNSIKYSDPKRRPCIQVDTEMNDEKVVISFKDNGLGIDLDRHGEKLFGMYKTFHRNKDAKGIGLFITKNQVEAMNGQINVQSSVNSGTTFSLSFDRLRTKI